MLLFFTTLKVRGKSTAWFHTRGARSPHSVMQCAAVSTHSLLMSEPPQNWTPSLFKLACQGQLPGAAFCPPMILPLTETLPQSDRGEAHVSKSHQVSRSKRRISLPEDTVVVSRCSRMLTLCMTS